MGEREGEGGERGEGERERERERERRREWELIDHTRNIHYSIIPSTLIRLLVYSSIDIIDYVTYNIVVYNIYDSSESQ